MTAKQQTATPPSKRPATPPRKRGSDMKALSHKAELGLIEQGMAFGVNTSALYQTQGRDADLPTPQSILLRLYEQFPEMLPRIVTPSFEEFFTLIRQAEPGFKETALGPLLGMHKNWVFKVRESGFDSVKTHTRLLILVMYRLLQQDLNNWQAVKGLVETEILSQGLDPKTVWRKGIWRPAPGKDKAPDSPDHTEEIDRKKTTDSQKSRRTLNWGS